MPGFFTRCKRKKRLLFALAWSMGHRAESKDAGKWREGERGIEVRSRRSEVGGQRTDDRRQKRAGVVAEWGILRSQIPSTKSQGVRYQVSGVREGNKKAET